MPNAVRPIPEGCHTITPSLTCRDAASAIEFYKNVLGATEIMRMPMGNGKIGHAELKIGDSMFMLNDEFPGRTTAPSRSGSPVQLFLYTEDVDSLFDRAVKAGCHADMAPENMFWGDRYGKITDPYGHSWGLATHVEDVAPDELARRSAEWTSRMAKAAGQS